RELITLCPWFTSLYQNQSIPFEETWFDACMQLNHPLAKGPRETKIRELLEPIENAMGGKVSEEQGRFYLSLTNTGGKIEAPLVAEGLRKFVMIARLIATGALLDKGYLFWDEPEANLNPKLIKVAARIIWSLSQQGIQVFIATHSLFLLRELELLKLENNTDLPVRFFSLIASDDGTKVEQGNSINDLNTLILLDENIMQADRYLNI
ncbi:AAA family ATPase, partial [Neisseria meningitidis]